MKQLNKHKSTIVKLINDTSDEKFYLVEQIHNLIKDVVISQL